MKIEVIGIGGKGEDAAKELLEAIAQSLGINEEDISNNLDANRKPGEASKILKSMIIEHVAKTEVDNYKRAKKYIKSALVKMRENNIAPDDAAIALSEVTCIFFEGMLKPLEGKTSKEAFMDYIGNVYDTVSERIKKVRAARDQEACNGR